mgnify:CR=1 FL=1|jgi:hypothetical protein
MIYWLVSCIALLIIINSYRINDLKTQVEYLKNENKKFESAFQILYGGELKKNSSSR